MLCQSAALLTLASPFSYRSTLQSVHVHGLLPSSSSPSGCHHSDPVRLHERRRPGCPVGSGEALHGIAGFYVRPWEYLGTLYVALALSLPSGATAACKRRKDDHRFAKQTPYYFLTTYTTLKVTSLDPNSILPAVPLIISNFTCGFGRVSRARRPRPSLLKPFPIPLRLDH